MRSGGAWTVTPRVHSTMGWAMTSSPGRLAKASASVTRSAATAAGRRCRAPSRPPANQCACLTSKLPGDPVIPRSLRCGAKAREIGIQAGGSSVGWWVVLHRNERAPSRFACFAFRFLSERLDHPFDHPDDPSGSVWTESASNVSRPDLLEPSRPTRSIRLVIEDRRLRLRPLPLRIVGVLPASWSGRGVGA
jgi:hypothetical protein